MHPNTFAENTLRSIKRFIPRGIFNALAPLYHFFLAFAAALFYRFPSRSIGVIGVTGTKGKSTVTELVNAVLEGAGYKTALSNTLRFKIGEEEERNMFKMSMPGRFFMQRFLRKAVKRGCQWVVLEMTSQGVLTHRHRFIHLDALVFTNISPEHIEAHGSFQKYVAAKLKIAKQLNKSKKERKIFAVNVDDEYGQEFKRGAPRAHVVEYSLESGPRARADSHGVHFEFRGVPIDSALPGKFNAYNILAAATLTEALGISPQTIQKAVRVFGGVRGRLEKVRSHDESVSHRQDFELIVDYAHTPDSLEKVYKVFEGKNRICVLGNTGGGRDKWKRKEMARIAENYCEKIILTNEDPYDEDPKAIVNEMARAITIPKYEIVMDRREAISRAVREAEEGDVVLITGKGTDPYLMGPNGSALPWDDASVAREEVTRYLREVYEE